jgi:Mrp family chromosome partitioning ATPase
MGDFKTRYDIIILDAPPMGAGSDAFILGSMTGNLAVVLRSGETEMDYATAKLEPLHRMPIRVLGAILNDVTPDFGYGSSRHYTDYLPGYAAGDEVPELTHSR